MKKFIGLLISVTLLLNVFIQHTSVAGNIIPAPKGIHITIENTLSIVRKEEVIELDWKALVKSNPQVMAGSFVVVNSATNAQYPYQVITDEAGKPSVLLVQLTLAAKAMVSVDIKKGDPLQFKVKTYGRFVPERKDDFAWENDKIAFRMYGPALQATGEISSGIDVWMKNTPEMILDKWYKLDDYHVDHGEGLDCYKVGPTLGAGGMAPYADGKLFYSKNWATYKIIATGNLRTVFELTYSPWQFNGKEITETKRITLNAGSQLNQIEVTYTSKELDTIHVVVGIVKRNEKGSIILNEKTGYLSYWEPASKQNGTTGLGIVLPENTGMSIVENHIAAFAKALNKVPMRYFQGACWDKAGEFKNENEWDKYLQEFILKLNNPLKISINQ